MSGFELSLPPRDGGLTHVIDKGLGPRGWEDVLETSGDYIDIVKLGWGTAYVTPNLRAKLDVLRDKPVVIGGTFFEAVIAQDKVDEYKRWLQELGLTHVIDKGLGPRAWEDVLEVAGDHISIIKLGWGTAAVTGNLQRKLEVLREKPVVIGGTYFEVVYAKGRLDDYKAWLHGLGLQHVEISDGTVEIPRERKLELIADFARDFTVLSEVGSKDSSVEYTAEQWVQWLQEELDAGAWKVITEAREGGTAGIFDSSGGMRTELIGEIAMAVGPANVIFEAPTKAAQVWFIKQFGPSVNLGNIPPEEVIPLETLRLGLRGDTLKEVLLGDRAGTPAS